VLLFILFLAFLKKTKYVLVYNWFRKC